MQSDIYNIFDIISDDLNLPVHAYFIRPLYLYGASRLNYFSSN